MAALNPDEGMKFRIVKRGNVTVAVPVFGRTPEELLKRCVEMLFSEYNK